MAKRSLKIEEEMDLDFQLDALTYDTPEPSKKSYTLMSALERIVVVSRNSELEKRELAHAKNAIAYVCERSGLSQMQAVLLAICVNNSFDPSISILDIRRWISCPMISLIKHQEDLEVLLEKGYLIPGYSEHECKSYAVPEHVVAGLNRNELCIDAQIKDLSFADFFDKLGQYFLLRRQGWKYEQVTLHIKALVKDNPQLSYCKQICSLPDMDDSSIYLLHYFCHRLVNHNDSCINEDKLMGILEHRLAMSSTLRDLAKGKHKLAQLELVEMSNVDGFSGEQIFMLSNKCRRTLLCEADVELISDANAICSHELIDHEKISQKVLYYSKSVQGQIDRLATLLDEQNFTEVCNRLKDNGMRKGFACLFYGAPGTGKTETALQLARITGRDIMQVDISEMRSKWVGESQKMVKAMFDRYRKAVKKTKLAPILLFNEADAILTKRSSSPDSSVDKMENSMQNIFLQEIETLEGILIATTNLTSNLDPAFERRFLYKVQFERPDAACRSKIWQSMISDITSEQAMALASKYDFSGGQIENISRKHVVDSILYGESDDKYAQIITYCDSELIQSSDLKKVGFVA